MFGFCTIIVLRIASHQAPRFRNPLASCANLDAPQVASCHLGDLALMRYRSQMGDAATFIAPALLVAYLAVGCLLLWGGTVRR
jgi:hypothetical protein